MAVPLSMSPDWVRCFSCIIASSCSRSTTRNLPLLTSSVTKTSCAAAAPPWYHHWLSALFLNSRTAMRGLSPPPFGAADRRGTSTSASRATAQRARVETRFMTMDLLEKKESFPYFTRKIASPLSLRKRCSGIQLLGIDHTEGRHVDDVAHFEAALQHVDGLGHALQDGADGLRSRQAPDQLVGGVGRLQLGEDEDIGRRFEAAPRIALLQDVLDDGGVGLHLAVDLQVRLLGLDDLHGAADFARRRVGIGAKVRKGEHGHPRHDAEAAGRTGGQGRGRCPLPRGGG